MTARASRASVLLATLLALVCIVTTAPEAEAATWTPFSQATITPGAQTITAGSQCTANFIFVDGSNVYIGQAAHCSSLDGNTQTNGCLANSRALGTQVTIQGATRPGVMVYNSWIAMRAANETRSEVCFNNDLALVKIDPLDHVRVNPSIPRWGGPLGLNTRGTVTLENVYSWGNSSLRFGLKPTSPKTGYSLGDEEGGWTHPLYTVTPGIPGDSGSAFIDQAGYAFGVLSTLAIAPFPASNNASDLAHCLDYMHTHNGPNATLEPGTEPFRPGLPV